MKLDDEVIAHIAKQVQIAILTGTDVVDNLRMIELVECENKLFLSSEYLENSENNLQKLLDKVKKES